MITCMEMKSFILKYASKIMFYDINIACYHVGIGGRLLMRNKEVISVIGIRGCPCNGSGARGEGSGHEDSKVS